MAARYDFRLRPPEQNLSVAIHESDAQGKLLVATHVGRRQAWSDAALLRAFAAFPLMTLKVIAGIHWEALKLWRKGVALVARPARDDARVPRRRRSRRRTRRSPGCRRRCACWWMWRSGWRPARSPSPCPMGA
jgi:DUF1365 family protein